MHSSPITVNATRWDQLCTELRAAGLEHARLVERAFARLEDGRLAHGVTRLIHIKLAPGRGLIEIVDREGNSGTWYGWTVCHSDARDQVTSLTRCGTCPTEVVEAAIALGGVAPSTDPQPLATLAPQVLAIIAARRAEFLA